MEITKIPLKNRVEIFVPSLHDSPTNLSQLVTSFLNHNWGSEVYPLSVVIINHPPNDSLGLTMSC